MLIGHVFDRASTSMRAALLSGALALAGCGGGAGVATADAERAAPSIAVLRTNGAEEEFRDYASRIGWSAQEIAALEDGAHALWRLDPLGPGAAGNAGLVEPLGSTKDEDDDDEDGSGNEGKKKKWDGGDEDSDGPWWIGKKRRERILEAVSALAARPDVEIAEENAVYRVRRFDGDQSEVPIFEHELVAAAYADQPALGAIGWEPEKRHPDGGGILVAVLDGGFELDHEAVKGRCSALGYDAIVGDHDPEDRGNGIDEDFDGRTDAGRGHGTAVAALILAIAPDAKILPIRVLDDEGGGTLLSVARGIERAVISGAHVINLSASARERSAIVERMIDLAELAGVTVVASAGQEGEHTLRHPAAYPYVIAVGGVHLTGRIDERSNFGLVDAWAPSVGLIAPYPGTTNGYGRWRGTSFAVALVSGACALAADDLPVLLSFEAGARVLAATAPLPPQPSPYAGRVGGGFLDLEPILDP